MPTTLCVYTLKDILQLGHQRERLHWGACCRDNKNIVIIAILDHRKITIGTIRKKYHLEVWDDSQADSYFEFWDDSQVYSNCKVWTLWALLLLVHTIMSGLSWRLDINCLWNGNREIWIGHSFFYSNNEWQTFLGQDHVTFKQVCRWSSIYLSAKKTREVWTQVPHREADTLRRHQKSKVKVQVNRHDRPSSRLWSEDSQHPEDSMSIWNLCIANLLRGPWNEFTCW